MQVQRGQHIGDHDAAVDPMRNMFVGMHAASKTVDEMRIGLEHQGDKRLLTLGGEGVLGGAIERVPGPFEIRC